MEFGIMGPLELVENGRPVQVSGRRQRALLALLLLHANEVVSSDRLIEGLWGEQPPTTAGKVLQNAVSQLRRSLGDDLIVTRAPGYLLRVEPTAIDARRFETLLEEGRKALASEDPEGAAAILREALALWRGPPLDEFSYEPFAQTEIARLEEIRLRALEERIEADLALGRHADLVGELERLVAEHPLRERPRGQLMVALYRSGRQAEALRVYDEGRRLLAEELGLEPGATLQRLEKQILTQDPALEPTPVVPPPRRERRRPSAAALEEKRRPRRRFAFALIVLALTAAAVLAAFLLARAGDSALTVVPDSIAKIDPETGEIVDIFRVRGEPNTPAIVGNYVFVSSGEDEFLSRIDVRSGEVDTFGGIASPVGIAPGADGTLWVGSAERNEVLQIDAQSYDEIQMLSLPQGSKPSRVASGAGSIWVSHNPPAFVSRFNARSGKLQQRYVHHRFGYAADVAFGERAAWAALNGPGPALLRFDAVGGGAQPIEIGRIPYAVAVGFGAVWLSDFVDDPESGEVPESGQVLRVMPETGLIDDLISVGKRPSGLTTGGGSVWVANGGDRTISEIDPLTNTVVRTIPTRYFPHSLAYGHGFLWVSLQSEPFSF